MMVQVQSTCWSVEVEYFDDLRNSQFVAHVADSNDVVFRFTSLKQLSRLRESIGMSDPQDG